MAQKIEQQIHNPAFYYFKCAGKTVGVIAKGN
jgi:hypothetical protein